MSENKIMKYKIYADNAATTKLDQDAFEAMIPWLTDEYGNASQLYSFARKPKEALAEARNVIAHCINAKPEEIFFTSCGTESDNWVIKCGAGSEGEIVISSIEHHAILKACEQQKEHRITYLPVSPEGCVNKSDFENAITSKTQLASIMLANNEIGSIQPIKELANIAHAHGILFHTDAVQAVGHIPIDVVDLGVDFLSASAHKFNAPKGTGFLFIRDGVEIPSFLSGGSQENNMRAGTENIAGIVAMSVALKKNCQHIGENAERLHSMEKVIIDILNEEHIDYRRNGSLKKTPGNISLSFAGAEGEMILHRMDLMGICISTGSACNSVNTDVSHVIKAIHLPEKYANGTVRISLGKYNTADDARRIAYALVNIIKK